MDVHEVGGVRIMFKSQRLIQLMMTVNAKRKFTVKELADEFGVSTRTIARDLEDLSLLGVPLYSEMGRNGGYKLLKERVLPPIAFSENEALAMFFACQSLQYFGSLPFEAESVSALQKFYHYLPEDIKAQIDGMKSRVVFWSPYREQPSDYLRILLRAAVDQTVVTIEYDSSSGAARRDIQPVGLYSYHGFWYCPAYCFDRHDFRVFRADRVRMAEHNAAIQPKPEVSRLSVWQWLEPELAPEDDSVRLVVRLTHDGVRRCSSNLHLGSSIRTHQDGSGYIDLNIPLGQLRYFTDVIWEFGRDAVIEQPVEAISYVKEKLAAVAALYS